MILTFNLHGPGGIARTIINLANHLTASGRAVEIISVRRKGADTKFPLAASVRRTYLRDDDPKVLMEALRQRDRSVVISTRPELHRTVLTDADGRHALIGQDHMNFPNRMASPTFKNILRDALDRLDAYVVLTQADARDYRSWLPGANTDLRVVRNASSFPLVVEPPSLTNPVMLAAGRLVPTKGFDRLITAFAEATVHRPEWELHICGGGGPLKEELTRLAADLGVGSRVKMLGHVADLAERMREAAFFALSSKDEGFPMVLIEAMSQGLPLLAFDCPRGPAEIVRDAENGFLIHDGDLPAFVAAMGRLMDDLPLRRRMSNASLADAADLSLDVIGRTWEGLIDEVARDHERRATGSRHD